MSAQRVLIVLTTLFYLSQAKPFFFGSTTPPPMTTEKEPKHTYHIIQIPFLTVPAPFGYHALTAPAAIGYQALPANAYGGWENSLNTGEEDWKPMNEMEDNFERQVEHHYHTYDNSFLSPLEYGGASSANGFIWPSTSGGFSGHSKGQVFPSLPVPNQGVLRMNSVGLPQYNQIQPHRVVLPTPSQKIQELENPEESNDYLGGVTQIIRGFVSGLVNRVASASNLPQPNTHH